MKFGVREICEVVLRAKGTQRVGNRTFFKNEPVIFFDTLKTSSLEGAATTVYATGGIGNSRLVAWEGERTVTFTMEDALISPEGFMVLTGAGLIEASQDEVIYQHVIETTDDFTPVVDGTMTVYVSQNPFLPTDMRDNFAYIMLYKDGEIASEPFIPLHDQTKSSDGVYDYNIQSHTPVTEGPYKGKYALTINAHECYVKPTTKNGTAQTYTPSPDGADGVAAILSTADTIIVDYYVARTSGGKQIDITPDKFGGNYYLEASTLFRDTNGIDHPAEFIIPNCKIQSNFTFTMASSGDPSTFTFTMDAFPDFTRFNKDKKVLAALQIFDTEESIGLHREATISVEPHSDAD